MIDKTVIEKYRNMELINWEWIKNVPKNELLATINLTFKTTPYTHQIASTILGMMNDSFLFFLDMGTGKTKLILDILSNKKTLWNKALILSPNASTVSTWSDEIKKHSYLSCIELMGTTQERWNNIDENVDIILLNYTGLLVMTTNTNNGKWVINRQLLEKLIEKFDVLVLDEIHHAKNHTSLTFKILKELSKNMKFKYGLTGTPINRDPMSLWSQFYLIDGGETLGRNISLYREAFFSAKPGYWGGVEYKFLKKYEEHLKRKIASKSIRYIKDEILDLPEKIFINIPINFDKEQHEWYSQSLDGFAECKEYKHLKLSFVKLRQICSGFLETDLGTIKFNTNKLDTLVDIINDIPENSKLVIFLEFINSGEIVSDRLKKEKIKHVRLYGGTKDKVGTKNTFINDPTCKVLIANIKSGGTGLNLQNASYVVYFEPPLSSIELKQSEDRVHRPGQINNCVYYYFITKHSVEERIYKYLSEGKDISKILLDNKIIKDFI